jgi:hypothetical protein
MFFLSKEERFTYNIVILEEVFPEQKVVLNGINRNKKGENFS